MSFLLFKTISNRAEDMKIYNSQLVMSLICRSTLQVCVATMVWCRQIHVRAPCCLASWVTRNKKITGPAYFITVRTQSRIDRVKDNL